MKRILQWEISIYDFKLNVNRMTDGRAGGRDGVTPLACEGF